MLRITCPKCQTKLEYPTAPADGQVGCWNCGTRLQLHAAGTAPKRPDAPAASAPPRPAARPPAAPPPARADHAERRPARRQDHDDDYDRPRRRSRRHDESNKSNAVAWIVGGSLAAIVIIGIVVVLVIAMSGDGKEQAKGPPPTFPPPGMQNNPLAPQNNGRPPQGDPRFNPGAAGQNQPPKVNEEEKPTTPSTPSNAESGSKTAKNDDLGSSEQPSGFGDDGTAATSVYNYVLKSAVFIIVVSKEMDTPQGRGRQMSMGSGSLVDRKNRLILTNHHVAGNAEKIAIFFPRYKDGKLISEKDRFLEQFKSEKDIIEGKVLATDTKRDLCLVQLKKDVPAGVEVLPLAKQSCRVGERIHSVGNPGQSGALWVYTPGVVRQLYHKQWKARGGSEIFDLEADVVEAQSATNSGDSGGPCVNDRGEMIGVTQGGAVGANLLSVFIDVSEARRFIENTVESQLGAKWSPESRAVLQLATRAPSGSLTEMVKNLESTDAKVRAKAAEGLGDLGEPAKVAIPGLLKVLKDPDDFTRRTAAAALSKIGLPAKSDVGLLASALKDEHIEVRQFAAATLGKMGTDARGAVDALVDATKDKDDSVSQHAARALGKLGTDAKSSAAKPLTELLENRNKETRLAAAEGLTGLLTTAGDLPTLQKMLKHQDTEARVFAVRALAKIGKDAKPVLPELLEAAKNDTGEMRKAVLQLLGTLTGPDAKPAVNLLNSALKDGDKEMKQAALAAIAKLGNDSTPCINAVRDALKDNDVKKDAIATLGKLGSNSRSAVPALTECLRDSEEEISQAALKAVGDIGPAASAAINDVINLFDKGRDIRGSSAADARSKTGEYLEKIAVVAGKLGKPALPQLIKALSEDNGLIRWGACKAIGHMGPLAKEADRALYNLIQVEPNVDIVQEAEKARRKVTGR